jgi:AraC-like DNA-binding protein
MRITRLLWKHAGGSPRLTDVPMPSARELERVRALMDAHSSTTLSLRELAAEVGMNRFQLIRAFARRYGVTPYAYFLDRRVERARRLVGTGRQLAAVAAECGFADQSHLTRHFKRIVGVTPGEYAAAVRRR